MAQSRSVAARQRFDDEQIARAAYFTTCRFLGSGRYDRERFETLDEADAHARAVTKAPGGRPTMVYAVTPEGWSIHVHNI